MATQTTNLKKRPFKVGDVVMLGQELKATLLRIEKRWPNSKDKKIFPHINEPFIVTGIYNSWLTCRRIGENVGGVSFIGVDWAVKDRFITAARKAIVNEKNKH